MGKRLGNLIRAARTDAGYTQAQLAAMVPGANQSDIGRYERGERGLALTEAYAMYRLLIDQRNMPGGLRGYSLYLLNKAGVFTNMVSRQYETAKVTEGGSFGTGRKWKLDTVKLNALQKRELDLLYDDMIEYSRKGAEK